MKLRPAVIILIPLMVALNIVLGSIVAALKLPVFLDSVGIVVAAILAGPWVAAAVGVGTTLFGSLFVNFAYWAFSGTSFLIGVTAGLLANAGFFRARGQTDSTPSGNTIAGVLQFLAWTIAGGIIITVVATIASAPVKAAVFGGVTASGSDLFVLAFRHSGDSVNLSVLKGQFLSEIIDKPIATLLGAFLAQTLSRRSLTWFPGSTRRIRGEG